MVFKDYLILFKAKWYRYTHTHIYSFLHSHLCCAESLSHVRLFEIPWTVARQAPLSMGILQARILEWVALPFSRGSSQTRDQTQVLHITGGFFTSWGIWETHILFYLWDIQSNSLYGTVGFCYLSVLYI